MSKTCFVISPIGEEGSEVRQHADDLYDLVLRVALEPFHFDVVRADKLPGSGQITTEIIDLVQRSELCVIDLTGHNANVYYECGRRHETGKPFVQLLRKGDKLPFDLAGIRTIMYSLETPRSVFEAVEDLRRYASEFDRTGYGPAQSGTSLSTLASAVERLERKLDRLALTGPTVSSTPGGMNDSAFSHLFENPRAALAEAIASGQLDIATGALRRTYELLGPSPELAMPAALLAQAGREQALVVLEEILTTRADDLDIEIVKAGFSSWVRYFVLTDRERDVLDRASKMMADLTEGRSIGRDDEAYMRNQIQMLHYGAEDFATALEQSNRTLELDPEVSSYWYNNSLIHERLNQLDMAERAIERCIELDRDTRDDDHLAQAIEIYVARNRADDARRLYVTLKEVSPSRAALVTLDPRVRAVVVETAAGAEARS